MDVLSDVLAGFRQSSVVFCHAELSAPWGFAKDRLQGAPFHAIVQGTAWVGFEEGGAPSELAQGDFCIVPRGDPHTLTSDSGGATVPFLDLLRARGSALWRPGTRMTGPVRLSLGGGGRVTRLISGVFAFNDRRENPLVAALPRLIHVRGDDGSVPWLGPTLKQMAEEVADGRPGVGVITARLADILFIQAIRSQLATQSVGTGWLRGMTDSQVGRSLGLIHLDPSARWTVATLASSVSMSRSGFAARFRKLVGQGPLEYLTDWRMHQAADLLADGRSLADIASASGYGSEVAFSKAFKRWAGQSPSSYRNAEGTDVRGRDSESSKRSRPVRFTF